MASQASSVLSSIPDQNWSDIEPLFRPPLSSPPVPLSQACCNTSEAAEDDDTPEKIAQKRTSEVWEHSFYSRHKITLDKQGRSIWRCKYCTQVYVDSGGTGNALRHLKSTMVVRSKVRMRSELTDIKAILIWLNSGLSLPWLIASAVDTMVATLRPRRTMIGEAQVGSLIQLY